MRILGETRRCCELLLPQKNGAEYRHQPHTPSCLSNFPNQVTLSLTQQPRDTDGSPSSLVIQSESPEANVGKTIRHADSKSRLSHVSHVVPVPRRAAADSALDIKQHAVPRWFVDQLLLRVAATRCVLLRIGCSKWLRRTSACFTSRDKKSAIVRTSSSVETTGKLVK